MIDSRAPMSYTSAQSGDNYRNWWPHPTMTAFTNDSIDELDRLAKDTNNVFRMTRGGYVLATRRHDISTLAGSIQDDVHVDLVDDRQAIKKAFPSLSSDINSVLHVRRGGDLSGQQLGQYMLEEVRAAGGRRMTGEVVGIEKDRRYLVEVAAADGVRKISAAVVVNAAGPFVNKISRMLNVELPINNTYQQKIAFEDYLGAIPRNMPFSIDLDEKHLNWSEQEKKLLADDEERAWLTEALPGGTHCRPEGGENGQWVKLGWAYNESYNEPLDDMANEPAIDPQFPEIVIRGAAALIPALAAYISTPPTRFSHYGGYYTMTEENWPLIGPLDGDSAFVVGALSGFGSMSACAAAKLCAAHVCGSALPGYAHDLSVGRYADDVLMATLQTAQSKGLL